MHIAFNAYMEKAISQARIRNLFNYYGPTHRVVIHSFQINQWAQKLLPFFILVIHIPTKKIFIYTTNDWSMIWFMRQSLNLYS